jgi:hypothetical protein
MPDSIPVIDIFAVGLRQSGDSRLSRLIREAYLHTGLPSEDPAREIKLLIEPDL